jgi:hypothetical protein
MRHPEVLAAEQVMDSVNIRVEHTHRLLFLPFLKKRRRMPVGQMENALSAGTQGRMKTQSGLQSFKIIFYIYL